jgi:K+-transporting ATPase ATPase B chain
MARREQTSSTNALILPAMRDALTKLAPRTELRNPVMFVVYVGAIWTTVSVVIGLVQGHASGFEAQIALWLWFTVLFANFAEAMAEGRGKAQADSLKRARTLVFGRLLRDGIETPVPAADLRRDDLVVCDAGDVIPADGEVIDGIASVDESAITGESAPVIRESGGDRSAVTGGTRVISDRIVIRITSEPGGASSTG